jgi:hypothetical protein
MPERKAQAHWEGSAKEGHGWIAVESGVVEAEYSFGSRFENRKGTNPTATPIWAATLIEGWTYF